jgi:YHS domain-containing protein
MMERDPICGMDVDRERAAAQSEYSGRTFYFCSTACKSQFDKNPIRYARQPVSQ